MKVTRMYVVTRPHISSTPSVEDLIFDTKNLQDAIEYFRHADRADFIVAVYTDFEPAVMHAQRIVKAWIDFQDTLV